MEVSIERIGWGGWENCYRITNGDVELVITSDAGPRVMRYAFVGGENVFYEHRADLGGTGETGFRLRGGHRIWVAPEHRVLTYAPDNFPCEVEVRGPSVEVTAPVEAASGLRKRILLRLAKKGSAVTVVHRITNTLGWEIELAPWALSMMAAGGVGITGFPPRGTHPEVLEPSNPLVMWAFTDLSDPRWRFTSKYLILHQDPANAKPAKLGHFNQKTWGGYQRGGDLFLKRYEAEPGKPYPDMGCSFETFTNDFTLELETLGPLTKLPPGGTVEHWERWTLHRGVALSEWTDEELDRVVAPLL